MFLRYDNKIINTEDYSNLEAELKIRYNLRCNPTLSDFYLIIKGSENKGFVGISDYLEVRLEGLEDLQKINILMEDIYENISNKTEYYNIGTKIKELKEENEQ